MMTKEFFFSLFCVHLFTITLFLLSLPFSFYYRLINKLFLLKHKDFIVSIELITKIMSTSLSKSANQFGIELFQCYFRRHGDKYKNLLLCPYLIYHSLAMMLVGAKGRTAEQLHKLLKIPQKKEDLTSTASNDINDSSTLSSNKSSSLASNNKGARKSPTNRSTIKCNRKDSKNSGSPIGSKALQTNNESKNVKSTLLNEIGLNKSRLLTPDGPDEARDREFLILTEQLIHGNHDFVHLASFIYLDKGTKRTERFKAILKDYYETKPKKIDFDNVDLMVKTVNEDVKRTTENIYNDILTKQEAQKLEKSYMLLVNAVFFRGFWLSNFTDVKTAPFTRYIPISTNTQTSTDLASLGNSKVAKNNESIISGKRISPTPSTGSSNYSYEQLTSRTAQRQQQYMKQQGLPKQSVQYNVNMMSKLDYLPVLVDEQLDARIIKMPFEASDLQMLIILPNNKESDATYLCNKISASRINYVVKQFSKSKSKTVRVSMPIFCIDSGKISIQSTLVEMGAEDLFDKTKANMSGVCENKQIWLHKILHRCFIICDNRGSITSSNFEKAKRRQAKFEGGISTGRSGVDEFVADHPFMYIIMDSVTKTILLMGLYTDPSETIEIIHENQLSAEEAHQIYTEGVYKT